MEQKAFYTAMAEAWREYEDGLLTEQEWFYRVAATYQQFAPTDPIWSATLPSA